MPMRQSPRPFLPKWQCDSIAALARSLAAMEPGPFLPWENAAIWNCRGSVGGEVGPWGGSREIRHLFSFALLYSYIRFISNALRVALRNLACFTTYPL